MQRIKKAYAESGDLKIIPDTPPLDGSENWEQGRGAYYELDNDPNTGDPLALDIDREQDNYFKNVISNNIKHWQENTYPNWFDDIEYPKNAIVKYTDGNTYVSKVDNNTSLPTDTNNWILLSLFNPLITGTVSFNSTTNNISLTNIVTALGLEIGDVIQISGAEDAKNNSEFTVEVITDDDNIIVNQAHANKGTSKNVASRSGDTGVTVKLLAKYYNAPLGLGQDWVNLFIIRNKDANYQNLTNRLIKASISAGDGVGFSFRCFVDDNFIGDTVNVYTDITIPCVFDIPNKSIYKASTNTGTPSVSIWLELR